MALRPKALRRSRLSVTAKRLTASFKFCRRGNQLPMRYPVAPKTVLVTGAAGFLGSHLCDALLSRGHRVIGVDDLSHGKRENLQEAMQNSRFSFHVLDITDAAQLRSVSEGVEVVAHLAAF